MLATFSTTSLTMRSSISISRSPSGLCRPVPKVAFDLLIKPQIKLLEAPSLQCVELVYEELIKICYYCTSPVWSSLDYTPKNGSTRLTYTHHSLGATTFPIVHAQLVETVQLWSTLESLLTFKSLISIQTTLRLP